MSSLEKNREQWQSKFGFLMTAIGSSIGLSSFWLFLNYHEIINGGTAYLMIYALLVLLLGSTVLLGEFTIGRKAQLNPVGAIKTLNKRWTFAGVIILLASIVLLSIFSVIGSWTIGYIMRAMTGKFSGNTTSMFNAFISGTKEPLILLGIFMILTMAIVCTGISNGIEKICKFIVPAIFTMLILITIRSLTLPNSKQILVQYLKLNFAGITFSTITTAATHALLTLSLGLGPMLTYSSYNGDSLVKDSKGRNGDRLVKYSVVIPVILIFATILTNLSVLPIILSSDNAFTKEGLSLIFDVLPRIFNNMQFGGFTGFIFFVVLFFAAIASFISFLEVVVSYTIDQWKWKRIWAVMGTSLLIAGLSVLCYYLSFRVFNIYKIFHSLMETIIGFLSFTGTTLICIFIGWFCNTRNTAKVLSDSNKCNMTNNLSSCKIWVFIIKFVVPIVLILVLLDLIGL